MFTLFVANMLDQLVILKKQQKPKKANKEGDRPLKALVLSRGLLSSCSRSRYRQILKTSLSDAYRMTKAWITGGPVVKVSAWDNECAEAVRLGSPPFISRDLVTIVINDLLAGMIPQILILRNHWPDSPFGAPETVGSLEPSAFGNGRNNASKGDFRSGVNQKQGQKSKEQRFASFHY